ncbi:unnamed protein product [Candida verbasci]|uniref:Uncharacterized protein n=1 Tax=Candida verbasci TaxID=1227364 RepID=A0A9W4X8M5_9ASCO|nr:unnamed protein product [Candida verbasci]
MSELFNRYQQSRAKRGIGVDPILSSTTNRPKTTASPSLHPKLSSDGYKPSSLYHDIYKPSTYQDNHRSSTSIPYSERIMTKEKPNGYDFEKPMAGSYLGSPIKNLNGSSSRRDKVKERHSSLYKTLNSSDLIDKYRISKNGKSKADNGGILSKLVNYFTHNENEEDFNNLHQSARKALNLNSPKRDRYTSRMGVFNDDNDKVDELINHTKELEHKNTINRIKSLELELRESKKIIIEEREENEKLNNELKDIDASYMKRLKILEQENESLRTSEYKYKQDLQELKKHYDDEISNILETHELELNKLEQVHLKQLSKFKNTDSELITKINTLEETIFDLNFESNQLKKENEKLHLKSINLEIELSLKDKLRISMISDNELDLLYKESSKIDFEIDKLEKEKLESSIDKDYFANKYSKTETNIENIKIKLENITKTLNFEEFTECETYIQSATNYISNMKLKCNNNIKSISNTSSSSSSSNVKKLLIEYNTLKRLNQLSLNLLQTKELLKDCKILQEYKDSSVDIIDIYCKIKREII